MYKKVIYVDRRDGKTKHEWFDVNGKRTGTGIRVDKRSETASIQFMNQDHVKYLGSFYHDNKD